jgi:GntR family transcriptional regulator/MocR family aminotransferase
MITSGIQESLDLVTRILINPGDRVLMEDPGYQIAVATLRTAGARVVPVPIDQYGVAPTSPSFAGAKLLYVTPGHQFPTGVTMPFSRRGELLHQARKTRTFIFEDDYDSEFRYAGSPIPSMQGVDRDDLLIFAGSFNKTLFPSLRMGYVVLPPTLVEPFTICKSMQSRHHPLIDQSVVCEFIEAGHFSRHLRRMRKIYAERLETLSYQVRKHLAGALELSQIEAGLQTVGWLTSRLSAEDVAALALQQNVDVVPLSRYCQRANMPRALQIGFAAIDEKAIAKGVQVLASVLTENAKRPGPLGRSTNWYR